MCSPSLIFLRKPSLKKRLKSDKPIKGWRIEVEILFAAFEQKDYNGKPQQILKKDILLKAPR